MQKHFQSFLEKIKFNSIKESRVKLNCSRDALSIKSN